MDQFSFADKMKSISGYSTNIVFWVPSCHELIMILAEFSGIHRFCNFFLIIEKFQVTFFAEGEFFVDASEV